jgi:hypothetical protein
MEIEAKKGFRAQFFKTTPQALKARASKQTFRFEMGIHEPYRVEAR